MQQTFQQDEAEQILVEAIRRTSGKEMAEAGEPPVTIDKILEMADELGISRDAVSAVLSERETEDLSRQRRAVLTNARRDYKRHLLMELLGHVAVYAAFSWMMFGFWWASPLEGSWPICAISAWGAVVCWHGIAVAQTRGQKFDTELALWQVRRQRRRLRRRRRRRGV